MNETLAPTVGNLAAGLGGIGLVVGSIGPWATVQVFTFHAQVAGTVGDGKLTLAAGIALLVCSLIAMTPVTWPGWLIVGISLAATGLAGYHLTTVPARASIGWGLVLCFASGLVALVGGISEIVDF